jgi:hypothetical protein
VPQTYATARCPRIWRRRRLRRRGDRL